jgi:hypothetical protein
MKRTEDTFNFGVAFILAYIAIEQIDARYFHPYMKEAALNSQIECHDDPKKCWLIDLKQRANQK